MYMYIARASFRNVKVIDDTMKNKDTDWVKVEVKIREEQKMLFSIWVKENLRLVHERVSLTLINQNTL